MRKFMISLAVAGSALAIAMPASAQYYPQPQPGYGSGYGQNNNWGQTRAMQARIDGIQRQIQMLHSRRLLSRSEYNGLRQDARNLEYRLRNASRNGLNYNELRTVEYRLARLEQKIRREVADGNRRGRGQSGYSNSGYSDRDRDGRNDRYEDDRGRDHD